MLLNKSNLENDRAALHHYHSLTHSRSQPASQSVPRRHTFVSWVPAFAQLVEATRYCLDGALSSGQWWWSGLNNLQQRADLSRIEDKLWPRSVIYPLYQLLRVTYISIQPWPDLAPVASISNMNKTVNTVVSPYLHFLLPWFISLFILISDGLVGLATNLSR